MLFHSNGKTAENVITHHLLIDNTLNNSLIWTIVIFTSENNYEILMLDGVLFFCGSHGLGGI